MGESDRSIGERKSNVKEAAAKGRRLSVHGGNPRMCWCTPVVREDTKLKKEALQVILPECAIDSIEMYRTA